MTPARRRECLAALHWTQRGLADILGWNESTIRLWLNGYSEPPLAVDMWLERRAASAMFDPPPAREPKQPKRKAR